MGRDFLLFQGIGMQLENPAVQSEFHSKEARENIDGTPRDAYNKSCCFSRPRGAAGMVRAVQGDPIGKGAN